MRRMHPVIIWGALILFLTSRFVCTWLMNFIRPAQLLMYMALAAAALSLTTMTSGGYVGVFALVAISACMSLMFPTIYGLGLRGLGEDTKIGGSGLIMAILGGAVLTGIQGQVSDATGSINFSYIVPLLCFVVIAYYGSRVMRKADSQG